MQRAQEEIEIAAAEEEILQHHLEMLSHKHNLEQKLGSAYNAVERRTLQQQQEQLANELRKVGCNSCSAKGSSFCKQNTILHFCPEPLWYTVFSEQLIAILLNQISCFITLIRRYAVA